MKLAWSVAGEGFGHAARLLALYPLLAQKHKIIIFAPKNVEAYFRKASAPGEPLEGAIILTIPAFQFKKERDRVCLSKTIIEGIPLWHKRKSVITELSGTLRDIGCEGVISDFEPFLPRAAKVLGLPIVQCNHPGIVSTRFSLNPQAWVTSLAARVLEGPADLRLHCSFYDGDVGPIIRRGIFELKPQRGRYLLLNLKEEYRPDVISALRRLNPVPDYKLYPDPRASQTEYDLALAGCRAIISSAGHQTISEGLFLKKPMLVIPQRGQYEQWLNAKMLTLSGRGLRGSMKDITNDMKKFVSSLDRYELAFKQDNPNWLKVEDSSLQTAKLIIEFFQEV